MLLPDLSLLRGVHYILGSEREHLGRLSALPHSELLLVKELLLPNLPQLVRWTSVDVHRARRLLVFVDLDASPDGRGALPVFLVVRAAEGVGDPSVLRVRVAIEVGNARLSFFMPPHVSWNRVETVGQVLERLEAVERHLRLLDRFLLVLLHFEFGLLREHGESVLLSEERALVLAEPLLFQVQVNQVSHISIVQVVQNEEVQGNDSPGVVPERLDEVFFRDRVVVDLEEARPRVVPFDLLLDDQELLDCLSLADVADGLEEVRATVDVYFLSQRCKHAPENHVAGACPTRVLLLLEDFKRLSDADD